MGAFATNCFQIVFVWNSIHTSPSSNKASLYMHTMNSNFGLAHCLSCLIAADVLLALIWHYLSLMSRIHALLLMLLT
jgi:hypothetical protein